MTIQLIFKFSPLLTKTSPLTLLENIYRQRSNPISQQKFHSRYLKPHLTLKTSLKQDSLVWKPSIENFSNYNSADTSEKTPSWFS